MSLTNWLIFILSIRGLTQDRNKRFGLLSVHPKGKPVIQYPERYRSATYYKNS